MKKFVQISSILVLFLKIEILDIVDISDNIESTKKGRPNFDQILKMPELGEYCAAVMLLSCFVEHPVL